MLILWYFLWEKRGVPAVTVSSVGKQDIPCHGLSEHLGNIATVLDGEHHVVQNSIHALGSVNVPQVLIKPRFRGNPQGHGIHADTHFMSRQLPVRVCLGVKLRVVIAEVSVRHHPFLAGCAVSHIPYSSLWDLAVLTCLTNENSAVMTIRISKWRNRHTRQIAIYGAHYITR